ncbi:electron transport complex subunit RsxC [Vallitaleaceae bacterium 9-2]
MSSLTFKKGIHPKHAKNFTKDKAIEYVLPEGDVTIMLQQHIGAPCSALVKVGDEVLVGQKIGDSESFVSAPVHSTVSGKVKKIMDVLHPNGSKSSGIIIENDGLYNEVDMTPKDPYTMSKDDILATIREAGIVGMGGAGFPTFIKLNPPKDKVIDYIIVNGAECEPYLTSDHRVMLEEADRVIMGLSVILTLYPEAKGIIGIEDNKPDAIEAMKNALAAFQKESNLEIAKNMEVATLATKYPQGAEKQLIYSVTKREVPAGKLPADAGCIVQNIDTVVAIHRAFFRGRPLMRRIVTLSGENVKNPGNYKVKIGTSYRQLIEYAGGDLENTKKIISGGPMMGIAIFDIDIPIIKTSSSILLLSDQELHSGEESPCIRCGKCVDACPMNLLPLDLDRFARNNANEAFETYKGMNCIECGSCSFVCPSKRHIVQSIRTTRRTIMAERRK